MSSSPRRTSVVLRGDVHRSHSPEVHAVRRTLILTGTLLLGVVIGVGVGHGRTRSRPPSSYPESVELIHPSPGPGPWREVTILSTSPISDDGERVLAQAVADPRGHWIITLVHGDRRIALYGRSRD